MCISDDQAGGTPVMADTNTLFQQAERLSESAFVPAHFRGKPENALIAVNIANRVGMDPYSVMKQLYEVHGTLGMTGQLAIALVNRTREWGPILFTLDEREDGIYGCTACARHRKTSDVAQVYVSAAMVRKEGWGRNKKWETMPEMMFRYRAAAFWARLYAPEALFGLHTTEEIEDVQGEEEDVIAVDPERPLDQLRPGRSRRRSDLGSVEEGGDETLELIAAAMRKHGGMMDEPLLLEALGEKVSSASLTDSLRAGIEQGLFIADETGDEPPAYGLADRATEGETKAKAKNDEA